MMKSDPELKKEQDVPNQFLTVRFKSQKAF